MFGGRFVKEIRGTVFLDSNQDGIRNSSEKPLKDVGIRLFTVNESGAYREEEDIRVLGEKQILRTKTNQYGEFRFLVREGMYSVSLEIDSLPVGKGVVETRRLLEKGESGRVDFAVREIDAASVEGSPFRINMGDPFIVNPVFRDGNGNPLSANINYLAESDEVEFRSNIGRVLPQSLLNTNHTIILDAGNKRWKLPVDVTVPDGCSMDRIQLAHKLRLMDEHTKIQYALQALFNKRNLPENYRSRIPIKSGTRMVEEIKRYMGRSDADPKVVETARQSLESSVPKLDKTYKSPSGYFTIHYTLFGEHAVVMRSRNPRAVPPYIVQVGMAFDQVRAVTCTTRGFREPILDHGKSGYDVYVYDLKGKYGITFSSQTHSEPNSKVRTASSYICIDNTYSSEKGFDKTREECMKVTAAHEFFHAIQYAYNADADTWWKEASATWNEDEIYTGINDYVRYIHSYFAAPHKSLDESSYGGVIFVKFLSENYGGFQMIKRIWEIQASGYSNSIGVIDRAIKESDPGQDIGRAFNRFSAYNVNPAQYYREGALWKVSAAVQHTYSDYPVALNQGQLNHLSSSYQLFKPTAAIKGKSLRIVIDGANGVRWGFKLQKRKRSDQLYSFTEITSNGAVNRAEILVKNFGEKYDEVCLIPANLEQEHNGLNYTYTANYKE